MMIKENKEKSLNLQTEEARDIVEATILKIGPAEILKLWRNMTKDFRVTLDNLYKYIS